MGFLLFAARKLQLKARLNDLNFRSMMLSQQQQTVSKQIADAQEAVNAAKNAINNQAQQFVLSNVLSGLSSDDTIKELLKSKGLASCSNNDLQTLLNAGTIKVGDKEIKLSQDDFSQISPAYQQLASQTQMKAAYATNVMNGIFDANSKAELTRLNAMDSQISLQLENNDSQLKLASAEYDGVKKAESQEAQSAAPTFGLA